MAEDQLTMAERHVREGRLIVARQRELVARQKSFGRDVATSQSLLDQFEQSLACFEDHLNSMRKAT